MATKINQFDKANLKLIRTDIQAAFDKIAEKYGMESLQLKNISFSQSQFRAKIEASTGQQAIDPLIQAKTRSALALYGLPEDTISRQFTVQGQTFQIIKIDTKKPKFPVIARLVQNGIVTEKQFKFQVQSVKSYLASAKA